MLRENGRCNASKSLAERMSSGISRMNLRVGFYTGELNIAPSVVIHLARSCTAQESLPVTGTVQAELGVRLSTAPCNPQSERCHRHQNANTRSTMVSAFVRLCSLAVVLLGVSVSIRHAVSRHCSRSCKHRGREAVAPQQIQTISGASENSIMHSLNCELRITSRIWMRMATPALDIKADSTVREPTNAQRER
jgi:hypothetical protein